MVAIGAALIGAAATIAAAFFGFWAVLKQNKKNEQIKLFLRIYEEIIEKVQTASSNCSEFNTFVNLSSALLARASQLHENNQPYPTPSLYYDDFLDKHHRLSSSVIDLMSLVENWLKIDPRIDIFSTAFSAAIHDVRVKALQGNTGVLMTALPIRQAPSWHPPSTNELEILSVMLSELSEVNITLSAYIFDFKVEMQKLLLGDLFDNEVPVRKTMESRFKTITLEDHEELQIYFQEQTDWGRRDQEARARVRGRSTAG